MKKPSPLNFGHLRYFWAVAKEGSVTGAASLLGVTMQTISGQISQLEASLGRTLFTLQGRRLVLTEAGEAALRYADQIFLLGEALQESLADEGLGQTLRLTVGIADAIPKALSWQVLSPALAKDGKVRLICEEGENDNLLADLALHRFDLVLSDRPVAMGAQFVCQPLLHCPVKVWAAPALADRYRQGFPASVHRAPWLLPVRDNVLRGRLEQWFEEQGIRPDVVAEFEDSALLETFGRHGAGLFALPAGMGGEGGPEGVFPIGEMTGVTETVFAITTPRKLQHAAVIRLLQGIS